MLSATHVVVTHVLKDGEEKSFGGGYRPQLELTCEVTCDVYPGDPGCYRTPNGDGWPATGPEVEIRSVNVTEAVWYSRPDFTDGISPDHLADGYDQWLAAHNAWAKQQIEEYHFDDICEKACSAANDEYAEQREDAAEAKYQEMRDGE